MKKLLTFLTVAAMWTAGSILPAQANEQTLPPGNYIFIGEPSLGARPKLFSIDEHGMVFWKNSAETVAAIESLTGKAATSSSTEVEHQSTRQQSDTESGAIRGNPQLQAPSNYAFETVNYPTIKWKPKPIGGIDGAIAQLATTIGIGQDSYGFQSNMKLKLTLLNVRGPLHQTRIITLLDRDGFKILTIQALNFREVPGTELREAHVFFSLPEMEYRKVADYTVD